MAWNTKKNGKQYFYLTERLSGGRARKKYYGRGPMAEAESARLEQRKAERKSLAQEKERVAAAESLLAAQARHTEEVVTASLLLAGFHNPESRGWRRKMTNANDDGGERRPPNDDEPERSFSELVAAGRKGVESVMPALREMMKKSSGHLLNQGDMAARTQEEWIIRIAGQDFFLREVVRMRLSDLKKHLFEQSNGTAIEAMLVDLVASSWLQLYYHESREAVDPAEEIRMAELRLKKIESAFRRHTKALATLATVNALAPAKQDDEPLPGVEFSDRIRLELPREMEEETEAEAENSSAARTGSAEKVPSKEQQQSPRNEFRKTSARPTTSAVKKTAKKKKRTAKKPRRKASADQTEPPVKKPK